MRRCSRRWNSSGSQGPADCPPKQEPWECPKPNNPLSTFKAGQEHFSPRFPYRQTASRHQPMPDKSFFWAQADPDFRIWLGIWRKSARWQTSGVQTLVRISVAFRTTSKYYNWSSFLIFIAPHMTQSFTPDFIKSDTKELCFLLYFRV